MDRDGLIRTLKLLDNLRVSLRRIGDLDYHSRDKVRMALDNYFTSESYYQNGIYREIVSCYELIVMSLYKEIGQDIFMHLENIPYYKSEIDKEIAFMK